MARKPSDDTRDAKRELKIKRQQFDWLKYNSDGESKGWSTDPTVSKSPYKNKPNPDGFRIDWDEKHHLQGLNLYDVYTQGMTPKQIKATDERLAKEGMYKGNNGLNRIDIPRRLHHSSKYPEYEGAHQQTMREGIDSKGELNRLNSLSPDQRFAELEGFVTNQARHRKVGQQKFMEQFQLEPGNDSLKNVFGGNFSQAILQERDKGATAKAGAALRKERQIIAAQSAFDSEILDQVPPNAFASVVSSKVPPKTTSAPQSTVRTPSTTPSTPKPTQTKTTPTGYVHRNRTPSETPPVTVSKTPPPTVLENLNTGLQNTLKIGGAIGAGALAIGKDLLFGFNP